MKKYFIKYLMEVKGKNLDRNIICKVKHKKLLIMSHVFSNKRYKNLTKNI